MIHYLGKYLTPFSRTGGTPVLPFTQVGRLARHYVLFENELV